MASLPHLADVGAQVGVPLWLLVVCGLLALAGLVAAVGQSGRGWRLTNRLNRAKTEIDDLRSRDTLTGLMTRGAVEAALDTAVQACDQSNGNNKHTLALLYVGLDNFRPVNEGFGPRVGDAVLVEVGKRLTACAGLWAHAGAAAASLASRVGGDEFVLLVQADAASAGAAADAVLQALQRPFCIDDLELQLSASVGVAVYPEHGSRPRLMAHAGLAMRSVKLGGGAAYACFDASMAVDLRGQAEMVQDLRNAVARGQLKLYYQPKIDARSLQITGAEALVRWQHPHKGLIGPGVFIPLAERYGLINQIGMWVVDEACRQAAEWRTKGLRMRVAVNISGHQMRQDDLVQRIEQAMRRHNIRPERLTCEITESVAMEDTSHTRAAFERLRQAGLHVSIDDFGTGHSSLAALRKLPAAELKIDRAFVTDLASSADARSIAQAIVQMAHSLDLRVVAEGVETEAQRDLLVGMGCDELQGYLFARPMTARSLAMWAESDTTAGAAVFRASLFQATQAAGLGN